MFNSLTTLELIIAVLIGTFIECWILYTIISMSTKSKKITEMLEKQNYILKQILENQENEKPKLSQSRTSKSVEGKTDLNDPNTLNKLMEVLSEK